MEPRRLSPEREAVFPNLRKEDYLVTSDEDWAYNCIAHAVDRRDAPWWPVEEGTEGVFWPEGIPREETLACFLLAFGIVGYQPCDSSEVEEEFDKIALYIGSSGAPRHAAKQLASGGWSSKLGEWEDIEHKTLASLEAGEGDAEGYGKVARILRRKRPSPPPAKEELTAPVAPIVPETTEARQVDSQKESPQ